MISRDTIPGTLVTLTGSSVVFVVTRIYIDVCDVYLRGNSSQTASYRLSTLSYVPVPDTNDILHLAVKPLDTLEQWNGVEVGAEFDEEGVCFTEAMWDECGGRFSSTVEDYNGYVVLGGLGYVWRPEWLVQIDPNFTTQQQGEEAAEPEPPCLPKNTVLLDKVYTMDGSVFSLLCEVLRVDTSKLKFADASTFRIPKVKRPNLLDLQLDHPADDYTEAQEYAHEILRSLDSTS